MNDRTRVTLAKKFTVYAAALLVLVVMMFPLYGLLLTSLQPESVIRSRDVQFFPRTLILDHFRAVFASNHIVPIRESIQNSMVISLLTGTLSLMLTLPAAYALLRLPVPGRKQILAAMASIYFLPTTLFLMPMFVLFVRWQLNDTFVGLLLPYVGFIIPFQILILRAFLEKIPYEVEEAAKIDGCSLPGIFVHIIFPLTKPGILAAYLFAFILSWIEFLTPLIFTSDLKIITVALGLYRSTIDIQIGQQAAAAVIALIPVALLTLVFQQLITKVVLTGADR